MLSYPSLIAEQELANAEKLNGHPAIGTTHEVDTPNGPPVASVPARAQSYSDLSHAVSCQVPNARLPARKTSVGRDEELDDALRSVMEYDDWQYTMEEELLDASHEDYEYENTLAWIIYAVLMQVDSTNLNSSSRKRI